MHVAGGLVSGSYCTVRIARERIRRKTEERGAWERRKEERERAIRESGESVCQSLRARREIEKERTASKDKKRERNAPFLSETPPLCGTKYAHPLANASCGVFVFR
jgi:hypothetical protein